MFTKYKIVPFCPYHFVHTILSNTLVSVPFCPLPFCPVTNPDGWFVLAWNPPCDRTGLLKLWVATSKWNPPNSKSWNPPNWVARMLFAKALLWSWPALVSWKIKRGHYKITLLVLANNLHKINALLSKCNQIHRAYNKYEMLYTAVVKSVNL